MPRSSGQKLKLLLLRDYLLQNTDENHPVTVRQMIDHLASRGVTAERKSLYTDLDALGEGGYGMDICNGYVVLRFGTDLSQPKAGWQCMSWFVDFEGDRAVVTIPEMSLENARRSIENETGRTASGLFLSVGIVTKMALDEDSNFLIMGSSSSQ